MFEKGDCSNFADENAFSLPGNGPCPRVLHPRRNLQGSYESRETKKIVKGSICLYKIQKFICAQKKFYGKKQNHINAYSQLKLLDKFLLFYSIKSRNKLNFKYEIFYLLDRYYCKYGNDKMICTYLPSLIRGSLKMFPDWGTVRFLQIKLLH